MTRVSRLRTRTWSSKGQVTVNYGDGSSITLPGTQTVACTCSDWKGRPVAPSPFSSTQSAGSGMSISGSVSTTYGVEPRNSYAFSSYPVPATTPSGITTTPFPAPAGWTLDLAAGTNPNKQVVTPLTLLQDLYELPRMILSLLKLIGKPKSLMSAKEISNHYLCAQFGWFPLIEDIHKLLHLQSYILKKNAELHKLYESGSGLRRRLRFKDETQNGSATWSYALYGPANFVDVTYDCYCHRRTWATMRWKPTTTPGYHPSEEQYASYARRIAAGLTVSGLFDGVWDLLPWSWMIDWFTNVSKFARAYANTVPVAGSDMCFMSESIRSYTPKAVTYRGCSSPNVSASGSYTRSEKTRLVSSTISAGFNVPYLDTFRLSILGALFVQRAKR